MKIPYNNDINYGEINDKYRPDKNLQDSADDSLSFAKTIEDQEEKGEGEAVEETYPKIQNCDCCNWDVKKTCTAAVLGLLFRREGNQGSLLWIAREILHIKLNELEKIFRFSSPTISRTAKAVEGRLRADRPGKNIEDNRSGN